MPSRLCWLLAVCLGLACSSPHLIAAPKPASVFGDQMVLQQGRPLKIWGTALAKESVTVEFAGQNRTVAADADGRWSVGGGRRAAISGRGAGYGVGLGRKSVAHELVGVGVMVAVLVSNLGPPDPALKRQPDRGPSALVPPSHQDEALPAAVRTATHGRPGGKEDAKPSVVPGARDAVGPGPAAVATTSSAYPDHRSHLRPRP